MVSLNNLHYPYYETLAPWDDISHAAVVEPLWLPCHSLMGLAIHEHYCSKRAPHCVLANAFMVGERAEPKVEYKFYSPPTTL